MRSKSSLKVFEDARQWDYLGKAKFNPGSESLGLSAGLHKKAQMKQTEHSYAQQQ
jgi:hypothetical protein